MLWWLLEIVGQLLADSRVQVIFTVPDGSVFADGVDAAIEHVGGRVAPWAQAVAHRFDLAIAASHRGPLDQLRCPLLLTPHGPGFNKNISLPSTASPVLAANPGRETPVTLILTHESLSDGWDTSGGVNLIVGGDPFFDGLQHDLQERDRLRHQLAVASGQRLVVVSSTWGPGGLLGTRPEFLADVLGQLPADEYVIAAALHPNIWTAHGPWQIKAWLRRASAGGLRLLSPRDSWRAALIGADVLIGDHGSVTLYGASLGIPVSIAAAASNEITPGSPVAELVHRAPQWDAGADAETQILGLGSFDPSRYRDVRNNSFAHIGSALARYRSTMYRMLNLHEPSEALATLRTPNPSFECTPVPAYVVSANVGPTSRSEGRTHAAVSLRRYPIGLMSHLNPQAEIHVAANADIASIDVREAAAVLTTSATWNSPNAVCRDLVASSPAVSVALACPKPGAPITILAYDIMLTAAPDPSLDPSLVGSALYALASPDQVLPDEISITTGARTFVTRLRREL